MNQNKIHQTSFNCIWVFIFQIPAFFLILLVVTSGNMYAQNETQVEEIIQKIKTIETQTTKAPIVYIRDLLTALPQVNDSAKAEINFFVAQFYFKQGMVDLAARYFFDALRLAEEQKNTKQQINILNHLVALFNTLGELENAKKFAQQAIKLAQTTNNNQLKAIAYRAMGGYFIHANNTSKAADFFQKSLEAIVAQSDTAEMATAYNNLAYAKLLQQDYFNAFLLLEKAKLLAQKSQIPSIQAIIELNYAKYFLEAAQNYNQAIFYLLRSEKITQQNNLQVISLEVFSLLATCYAKQNRFEQAYFYQQKYKQLNHKLINNEKGQMVFRMQLEYEIRSRQRENELLQRNNQLQQMELKQHKQQMFFFMALSVTLFFALWMLYKRGRIQHKSEELLAEKNSEIQIINKHLTELNTDLEKQVKLKTQRLVAVNKNEQQARQRLELLLTSSGALVFSIRAHSAGILDYISPNLLTNFGIDNQKVIGNNDLWYKYVHLHDQEDFFLHLSEVYSGHLITHEFRLKNASGQYKWMMSNMRLVKDEHNNALEIIGALNDISALKDIELQLKNETKKQLQLNKALRLLNDKLSSSEQRFRNLIKLSPEIIFEFDSDGHILFYNDQVFKSLEYSANDLNMQLNFFDLFENKKQLIREVKRNIALTKRFKLNGYRAITKNGTPLSVILYFNQTRLVDEKPVLLALLVDISEYEKTRKALEKSEERYRDLYENANDMLFRMNTKGRLLECNQTAVNELGYSYNELINSSYKDLVVPEFVPFVANFFDAQTRNFEIQIFKKDGTKIWLDIKNKIQYDQQNKPIAIEATARDITERKNAELSLHKFKLAVDQNASSIYITNKEGIIEYVNKQFIQHLEYRVEELVGQQINSFDSPYQQTKTSKIWAQISAGQVWKGRLQTQSKSGKLYWETAIISPLLDTENRVSHFIGIRQDITRQLEIDEQLKQSQKLQAIGTLAGGISHDFNNILSGMLNYTQLALLDTHDTESVTHYLQEIMKAGNKARHLIAQILLFSRKSAEKLEIVQINTVVDETLRMFKTRLNPQIQLVEIIHDVGNVEATPTYIQQIVLNLCINAEQAIDGKGKIIVILKKIGTNHCLLKIKDNGKGMSDEVRKQIFNPFFTTKAVGKGTGLGLSTVHGIVEKVGGKIDVKTKPKHGTSFEIILALKN